MDRETAVDRVEAIVETVESDTMPVPVREVWVFGDVALGLDPIDRLDVYVTKDILLGGGRRRDEPGSGGENGDAGRAGRGERADRGDGADRRDSAERGDGTDRGEGVDPEATLGVKGIGSTVRAEWADEHPDAIRANDNGYAAPEKCLAAHLIGDTVDPIHLEVCNASFGDNVTQRLKGALARDAYDEILDPRGVCLWVDGRRDPEAFEKLRAGAFTMPTLKDALGMMGAADDVASDAAAALKRARVAADGASVRGDIV